MRMNILKTVAYPLDAIRRRMQMVGWKNASTVITGGGRKVPFEYRGMVDAFRKTVRYDGVGTLFRRPVMNPLGLVLIHSM